MLLTFRGKNWCCQTGLNCRPLHYQWSALPLSYGSVPDAGISQKAPTGRADPCHKAPARASARPAREVLKKRQNQGSCPLTASERPVAGRSVPHFLTERDQRLDRAGHDLESIILLAF